MAESFTEASAAEDRSPQAQPARPAGLPTGPAGEARLAMDNGVKLLASLAGTWTIAIAVRLLLPRALGPERLGALSFAEAFAGACFVVLSLGVDTHLRKEAAVSLERTFAILGGVLLLRVLLAGALLAAMLGALHAAGRSTALLQLVAAFAIAQLLAEQNNTVSALLHAAGRVDGLSAVNVAAKLLWAIGVTAIVLAGLPLAGIALAAAVAEAFKAVALHALARRTIGLRLSFEPRATWAALVVSLPFFLNTAAHAAYAKLDVNLLGLVASDREVGFYGAAGALAGLAGLISPLVGWILLPLFSRAASRSAGELSSSVRRALELVVCAVAPLSLALALAAGPLVTKLFGAPFAASAGALRLLAPMFVLTWASVVLAAGLIAAGRGWQVTAISGIALVVDALLVLLLLPAAVESGRAGAGGAACATALLLAEAGVLIALVRTFGRAAIDSRLLRVVAGTGLAALSAAVVHALVPSGLPGLLLALGAYAAVVLALGAVRPAELIAFVRAARRRTA